MKAIVFGVLTRLLYLRSWGKLSHLITHPRRMWSFVLRNREVANFTYEMDNEEELPAFIAEATGEPVDELRGYLRELAGDTELHGLLRARIDRRDRSGRALVGRRAGWYILVRALRPKVVLETGTDVGMGSAVLARALQRNAERGGTHGHLWTFDFAHDAGWATPDALRDWITLVPGDLRQTLPATVAELPGAIDLMIHDSDHAPDHELFEFRTVGTHLASRGVLLTDNGHATTVLQRYSDDTGRRYSFWRERPRDHPYPGAGIGLSVPIGGQASSSADATADTTR
jgi:predicted O-methyltransferase YrrM